MDLAIEAERTRLFPTKTSCAIFWAYISLFVSQGLLVTAVQKRAIPGFNAVFVVLLVEVTKLLACIAIYILRSPYEGGLRGALRDLVNDIQTNKRLLLLYLVPAFLYCLYNNLTFVNLSLFDVSTYYCLMQFRIVLTALIYQILFRRQLNLTQWTSLLILTVGCLVKQYGVYDAPNQPNQIQTAANSSDSQNRTMSIQKVADEQHEASKSAQLLTLLWSTGLLLLQMFCSCFAGVYNEYLIKDSSTSKRADIILQNIFMYLDSIICNLIALPLSTLIFGKSNLLFSELNVTTAFSNLLTSPFVLILILNNAASGLVASFFLKSLNSILKTFAAALELFAVTFLAWILFNNKVDVHTLVALSLISIATVVYSYNPVSVAPPTKLARVDNQDGFVPLPMDGKR